MARRSGTGTAGLPPSTCRSTSSMARSSRSPDLLALRIAWIASAALAGSAASCMLAAVAWTLIIAIECATTSCSSRAIRIRSASTRLRVSSSRACSARAARSDSAASHWRRAATYAPTAPAASSSGHIVAFGPPNQPNGPSSPSVTKIAAAPASPAATAMTPRAGQRDPVHADDDRNERGTVDLAERRPPDRAAHGEPEHLDRTAVAPDQGDGRAPPAAGKRPAADGWSGAGHRSGAPGWPRRRRRPRPVRSPALRPQRPASAAAA